MGKIQATLAVCAALSIASPAAADGDEAADPVEPGAGAPQASATCVTTVGYLVFGNTKKDGLFKLAKRERKNKGEMIELMRFETSGLGAHARADKAEERALDAARRKAEACAKRIPNAASWSAAGCDAAVAKREVADAALETVNAWRESDQRFQDNPTLLCGARLEPGINVGAVVYRMQCDGAAPETAKLRRLWRSGRVAVRCARTAAVQ